MKHGEFDFPTERFYYVEKTRLVYEYAAFWDTKEEAEADAAKHPGAVIYPPEPKGSIYNP